MISTDDDTAPGYAYSNRSPQAAAHHAALAALYDRRTMRYLNHHYPQRRLPGARCLMPAAGGGALVQALSNMVGPGGLITATDLHPDMLPVTLPNVQVLLHDLNDPPPPGPYDLIHARLILGHLPARERILGDLIAELAPGGMLMVEDFDPVPADRIVATAPTTQAANLIHDVQLAHRRVLNARGNDPTWALRAHGLMVAGGLARVHSQSHAECWPGGSAGGRLMGATLAQLRPQLVATGLIGDSDLSRVVGWLNNDPGLVLHGHRMVTTSGLRPEARRAAT